MKIRSKRRGAHPKIKDLVKDIRVIWPQRIGCRPFRKPGFTVSHTGKPGKVEFWSYGRNV